MPTGRPSKYKPKFCQELIDHMSQGYSFESFSGKINVNQDTLYEWAKRHKKFSEAKKVAFNKCLLFWEQKGIEGLFAQTFRKTTADGVHTSVTKSINARLFEMNVKYRFKTWRETNEDDTNSNQSPTLIINVTNDNV